MLGSCREAKLGWRGLSKVAAGRAEGETGKKAQGWTTADSGDRRDAAKGASSWVPHPRTGIYFPKGHDHVMEDVPDGAACFDQTCWFRTVDGVDKADHDVSTDY